MPLSQAAPYLCHMAGAVVIFSGGQDSTTCLAWAMRTFPQVLALTFAYGQRHAVELQQAEAITRHWNVPWQLMPLNTATAPGRSSLTDNSVEMPSNATDSIPNTFVPGRNLLFLNYAAIVGWQQGMADLVIGASAVDYSGYPDCRPDFLTSAQQTISLALGTPVTVHAPLIAQSKADTWRWADELGVLDDVIELSHTCYRGDRSQRHAWGYGCGQCPACELRARGYAEAFGDTA